MSDADRAPTIPRRRQGDARQVFDVAAAGDTVIATLAAMVAAGLTLREAGPIANRAAGIVVSRFGTAHARFEEVFP
jgi:D-glycero-beta-D-manno-heptose-7-phosphate kinase